MKIDAKQPVFINGLDIGVDIHSVTNEIPHYHKGTLELLLCLSGAVKCVVSHRCFELAQGDFVAVNSNEVHYCNSDEDNILVSLYIDNQSKRGRENGLESIYIDNIWGNTEKHLVKKKKKVLLIFLTILFFYINERIEKESERVKGLVDEMLDILVSNFQLFYVSDGDKPHSEESKERFQRIIAYLKMNYNRKITIDEISSSENLSSNYLSQYVKKATLLGITKILMFIRTHESESLLLSHNLSVVDIAYECGFSDPKLYYKAFKEVYGCTPKQHRDSYAAILEKSKDNTPLPIVKRMAELEHCILQNISKCI